MPVEPSGGARRVLALLTGLQSLVLAAFAAFYLYELSVGEGSDAGNVVVSSVLIAGAAVALAVLTRGWLGTGEWARTPTIVWNLLLLPVGWTLVQAGRAVGWAVLGVAVVATLVAFVTRTDRNPAGGDSGDGDGDSGEGGSGVSDGGPGRGRGDGTASGAA